MKFKIVNPELEQVEEKEVKVHLYVNYDGDLTLSVGKWDVFSITQEGAGYLVGSISENNEEGLQVNAYGKIILENGNE